MSDLRIFVRLLRLREPAPSATCRKEFPNADSIQMSPLRCPTGASRRSRGPDCHVPELRTDRHLAGVQSRSGRRPCGAGFRQGVRLRLRRGFAAADRGSGRAAPAGVAAREGSRTAHAETERDGVSGQHSYSGLSAARPAGIRPDHGLGPGLGGDKYAPIEENPFQDVQRQEPLSTFSIDVDTASYSKVRMYLLEQATLPRPDAVRLEELINYFPYDYEAPQDGQPFAGHLEAAECPWAPEHRLVRIGIKGREIPLDKRPASNLVFLFECVRFDGRAE